MRSRSLDLRTALKSPEAHAAPPRVCVLFGTTRGDNAQLMILAQALGWPFEVKGDVDNVPMTIVDRVARAAGMRLRRNKPLLSSLLWPDLILITGGRRVIDSERIKAMSEGRSKIVCVGRPWADLDLFDLVVTTPQYRLPERPNILMNTLPLNLPSDEALSSAADEWRHEIVHLPKPWITVLVGGNSGSCRFTEDTGRKLAAKANDLAEATGGSLLISTSGRTPKAAADAMFATIDAPHVTFRWDKAARRNPHLGFLALADRFVITSDSASMAAEAIASGRPVSIFEVPIRKRSRWMTRPRDPDSMFERLRRSATIKGLWVPARDMNTFHENLRARGYVQDSEKVNAPFTPKTPDDLERAVQAICALFPGIAASTASATTEESERSQVHGLALAG
ncbi:MAG: ELM1/GtrOC1 family putative glycosyltransferase [Pseudomonadota bacterium]